MHYDHQVQVRYGETDQMGVVHHANYLLYFEEARTAFLASQGQPYGQLEKDGLALPVRKLDLRFRAPAHYEDKLRVRVSVDRITAASVRFIYEIRRPSDEVLIATGSTELACIDLTATPRVPHVLPKAMRELFA